MQENKTLIFINVRLFILEISDILTIRKYLSYLVSTSYLYEKEV